MTKQTLAVWWMSLSAGCVFMAAGALAQDANRSQPAPDRSQPAQDTDHWLFSLTVAAHYDDNRDALKDNPQSDLDLIVRPRATLLYNLDQTFLRLFYEPSYTWRSDPRSVADGNPQNREEWYQSAGLTVTRQFSPLVGFKAGDIFAYTDDPSVTEGGVAQRQNNTYLGNRLYGSLDVTPSRVTYGRLDASYSLKRYKDKAVSDNWDEDVVDSVLEAGHTVAQGMNAFGQLGVSIYQNASTNMDRGSKAYTFAGGLEKTFTPDFTGRITAGYQEAVYDDSGIGSKGGWLARLETTLGGSTPTRLRLLAEHGFYMPYVLPYSIQEMSTFRAAVDHDVTRDLMLSVSGQYTDSFYPAEASTSSHVDLAGGHDRMTDVGLNATYRINRNFSCGAGYRYQSWDSDVRESYSHNMIDLSFTGQL